MDISTRQYDIAADVEGGIGAILENGNPQCGRRPQGVVARSVGWLSLVLGSAAAISLTFLTPPPLRGETRWNFKIKLAIDNDGGVGTGPGRLWFAIADNHPATLFATIQCYAAPKSGLLDVGKSSMTFDSPMISPGIGARCQSICNIALSWCQIQSSVIQHWRLRTVLTSVSQNQDENLRTVVVTLLAVKVGRIDH